MNFDLDRDATAEPSLAEMTTAAMDALAATKKNGYFLMVEGGRIDQALHPTLGRKALQDAKAFDDAIKAAIAKARLTDPTLANTLIVVTADHDHTMVMNGYAAEWRTAPALRGSRAQDGRERAQGRVRRSGFRWQLGGCCVRRAADRGGAHGRGSSRWLARRESEGLEPQAALVGSAASASAHRVTAR